MLPIKTKLSISTDISPSENIELSDGNQSQMFVLSSKLSTDITSKQHRHRKMSKLDDSTHIPRTPSVDITFANHHLPSTMMHECGTPFGSSYVINNNMIPVGHYIQPGQYRVNNNGPHILPFSFTSVEPSMSTPPFDAISMAHITAKMPLPEFNSLLKSISDGRALSMLSSHQSCPTTNHQCTMTDPYSLPSLSSPPITTSVVPPVKAKRKYTRRAHLPPPIDQQIAQCPNASSSPRMPSDVSSSLLPSMTIALVRPEEHHSPVDMSRTSNFTSLSDSKLSSNSPSTITDSKSALTITQHHSLPHHTTNTHELYQTSTQRLADQKFSLVQNTNDESSPNNLSYNFTDFMPIPHEHYFMVPSNPMFINMPPMSCSSLLPESFAPISLLPFPDTMENMRKKRKSLRKKSDIVPILKNEENAIPKPVITETSVLRKRLQKKAKIEDNRTKTLIRHMKHSNKLAVLKFMVRKRKQQQQESSNNKFPEFKIEEVTPDVSKTVKMETNLAAVIASNLKVTFDGAQKIASISLYYHQQRKHETHVEHSSAVSNSTDNKLGLLIEAVDFLETYNGSTKLALESIK